MFIGATLQPVTFRTPRCVIPVLLPLHLGFVSVVLLIRLQGWVHFEDKKKKKKRLL